MQQMLEAAGYEIVDFAQKADVYVINTCSVTNMADRKSRQMIHRARGKNADAVIVATGCYVQTAGEEIKKDLSIDILIGNNKKTELVELLDQYFEDHAHAVDVIDINDGVQPYEELQLAKTGEHTRAFMKVQDGCNQFCIYCIIPYARGRVRSRDPKSVYEEARALAENGYREIVLTGIHLSSYGAGEDFGLVELIRMVHEIPGVERIRLGSLEPRIITEEFVRQLRQMPKVCPHFHLSLQSGCDETLARMNRKYTTEEYAHSCALLRDAYDRPAITTDVIAGFVGETEAEHAETLAFVRQIGFARMHVFPYSRRKGTRADGMAGHLTRAVKEARAQELIRAGEAMERSFIDRQIGTVQEVLLEDGGAGYTGNYVRVRCPGQEGETKRVRITGREDMTAIGEEIDKHG